MAVISISRQFGAGGKTLAERVADRLGFEFVDDELVSMVARAANVSIDTVEEAGRRSTSLLQRFASGLTSTSFLSRVVGEASAVFREDELYRLLDNIVPELAARDNVVFLGRASQFILPSDSNTIKVLLVGSEFKRVHFMMEHYGLNQEEAEKVVTEWDKNRVTFLKRYTPGDPNDLSTYDLTINTDQIRLDWAEDIIYRLARQRRH